jgi:integrase
MRRLIEAAAEIGARTHALVLLGLHGGLRRGEILGLDWADLNLSRRQLTVRRHQISKYVDTPKSGHGFRRLPSASSTKSVARVWQALTRETKSSSFPGEIGWADRESNSTKRHFSSW